MISVYQAKNTRESMFNERTTLTVKEMVFDFEVVANVNTDDLDQAYELTNTIHQPWWTNEGVMFKGSPTHGMKGCRSTSVGDVMIKPLADGNIEAYVVASAGFDKLRLI